MGAERQLGPTDLFADIDPLEAQLPFVELQRPLKIGNAEVENDELFKECVQTHSTLPPYARTVPVPPAASWAAWAATRPANPPAPHR